MRIVQVANFYGPESGGLRTALDALGRGYVAAGHERVLVIPGASSSDRTSARSGRRITVAGRRLGSTGYHVVTSRPGLAAVLERVRPDRLEVSDKLTLGFLGDWARARDIPSILLSHERLDAILRVRAPRLVPLSPITDAWNRRLVRRFDHVVCTSAFAREEMDRIGAPDVTTVPLGVDLDVFSPAAHRPSGTQLSLVCVGRLSREKRPELAVAALQVLLAAGIDARLTLVGGGPMRSRLARSARDLPVTFTGHVMSREALAELVASADVALNPCPVEAFGLAVLEALACGTPVVVPARGAARELVQGGAGVAVDPTPEGLARGVIDALDIPRSAARGRAEQYTWSTTIEAMLRLHGATAGVPV